MAAHQTRNAHARRDLFGSLVQQAAASGSLTGVTVRQVCDVLADAVLPASDVTSGVLSRTACPCRVTPLVVMLETCLFIDAHRAAGPELTSVAQIPVVLVECLGQVWQPKPLRYHAARRSYHCKRHNKASLAD